MGKLVYVCLTESLLSKFVFVKQQKKKSDEFLNGCKFPVEIRNAKKLNSTFNLEIQFLLLRTIFYKNNQFLHLRKNKLPPKRQFQNEHGFV